MLRASAKQSLFKLLDESYFGASNFSIEYGEGSPLWFKITFIPNSNFSFSAERGNLGTVFFQTTESPGLRLLKPEHKFCQSFEECVDRVPAWIERIKEEVVDSSPVNREIQAVRRQLDERIDQLAEGQEDFFTRTESDQLSERLNEFLAKLDLVSENNADLQKTVDALKARIDELSEATQTVNKGTWLRMASSRLLQATKAIIGSKEGREFALEAAKKVLLDGPK